MWRSLVAILDDNAEVVELYFLFTKFSTDMGEIRGVAGYNHGMMAVA